MNKREIPFPEPVVIARRNYWRKCDIRRWRAAIAGQEDPAPQSDDEVVISSRQVRDLFGGVSDMWLWRKRQRPAGNPPPAA
jgi:hypothetical protein